MNKFIYLILILLVPSPVHATFQIPERVDYNDVSYETLDEPFVTYIEKNKIDITKITQSLCSANWRGYVGKWVIHDGYLYLEKLFTNSCGNEKEIKLIKIIPNSTGLVKAKWYNGKLNLFIKGKVHNGKPPLFILNILNGKVQNEH